MLTTSLWPKCPNLRSNELTILDYMSFQVKNHTILDDIEKRCPQCHLQRMDSVYSPGTWVMSLCVNNFILTKENTMGSILGGQTWTKKYPFHFWNFFGRNETMFIIECRCMFGFLVGLFFLNKFLPIHWLFKKTNINAWVFYSINST